MRNLRIAVKITAKDALKSGSRMHGRGAVAPSEADLAACGPDARYVLARYALGGGQADDAQGVLRLDVMAPTWPAVLAAIVPLAEERGAERVLEKAREEERERAKEAAIVQAIAAPDSAWIAYDGEGSYRLDSHGAFAEWGEGRACFRPTVRMNGPEGCCSQAHDPRIIARRAEVLAGAAFAEATAVWERRYAEWQAFCREAEARAEVEKAAKAAREVAFASACRDYVIAHVPEYRRAAEDGRDVETPAVADVRDALLARLRDFGFEPIEDYGSPKEHARPRTLAYETLDKVRVMGPIPYVEIVSSRIVRVDTCPERECKRGMRTAIELEIRILGAEDTGHIYVLADNKAVEHEHPYDADDADEGEES